MFYLNNDNFKREPYRGYCPSHLEKLLLNHTLILEVTVIITLTMNML